MIRITLAVNAVSVRLSKALIQAMRHYSSYSHHLTCSCVLWKMFWNLQQCRSISLQKLTGERNFKYILLKRLNFRGTLLMPHKDEIKIYSFYSDNKT